LIAWTGRTFGINAIHFSHFEARDGGTFVRTEEPYEGVVARLLRRSLQKTLDRALVDAGPEGRSRASLSTRRSRQLRQLRPLAVID
jgi:hypothetical protein